jgi:hypothetical protein
LKNESECNLETVGVARPTICGECERFCPSIAKIHFHGRKGHKGKMESDPIASASKKGLDAK